MPDSTLSPGKAGAARDRNRRTSEQGADAPHGAVARAQRVGKRWREVEWVDFTSEPDSGTVPPPPAPRVAPAPQVTAPQATASPATTTARSLGAALRHFAGPPASPAKSAPIPGLKSRFTRLPVPLSALALAPQAPAASPAMPPEPASVPPAAVQPAVPPPPAMPRTGSIVVHPRTPAAAAEPPPLREPLAPPASVPEPPAPRIDERAFPASLSTPVSTGATPAAKPGGNWRAAVGVRVAAASVVLRSASGGIAATAGQRLGRVRQALPPRPAVVERAAAIVRHPAVDRLRRYLAAKENRLQVSGVVALSVIVIALVAYLGGAVVARVLGSGAPPSSAPAAATPDAVPSPPALSDKVVPPPQTAALPPAAPATAPSDPAARAAFYMERAKAGDAAAQYDLGVLYARGDGLVQDFDSAATWFHAAAAQGDVSAEYNLGVLYDRGLGVPTSKTEALNWYRSAADQNHPGAQFNLALAYADGDGTKQDFAAAARWYKRAAEQGLAPAMVNLAILYEGGTGIGRSPVDAYAWYSAAGERGDPAAKERAGELFRQFNDRDKAQAEGLAATIGAALDQQKPPA